MIAFRDRDRLSPPQASDTRLSTTSGRGEVAADLTAEAFAEALSSAGRFDAARGDAAAWLFGIARHLLVGLPETFDRKPGSGVE
jgi:hypothetical protein